MTYDPRKGQNPYLGMDDTYEDDDSMEWGVDDVASADVSPRTEPARAGGTRTMSADELWGTGEADATGVSATSSVPKTILRDPRPAVAAPPRETAQRPARSTAPTSVPGGVPSAQDTIQGTALRRAQPIPSAGNGRTASARPSRGSAGFLDTASSFAFRAVSLALRLAAIGLSLYVVASAVLTDAHRATLVRLSGLTNLIVPNALLGQFVFETPFGGAFRGDLAIVSIALFIADWACLRHANNLRARREMGV